MGCVAQPPSQWATSRKGSNRRRSKGIAYSNSATHFLSPDEKRRRTTAKGGQILQAEAADAVENPLRLDGRFEVFRRIPNGVEQLVTVAKGVTGLIPVNEGTDMRSNSSGPAHVPSTQAEVA